MTFYAVSLKLPTRLERSLRLVDTERAWAPSPRPPLRRRDTIAEVNGEAKPPTDERLAQLIVNRQDHGSKTGHSQALGLGPGWRWKGMS